VAEITFLANDSTDFMTQALTREPGDILTLTETVTGLSSQKVVVHRVELVVRHRVFIECRFGLAPASPFNFWQWGITGASEWGQTTVFGF
jgi:hypothetical protein